jgi:hypothetical protein
LSSILKYIYRFDVDDYILPGHDIDALIGFKEISDRHEGLKKKSVIDCEAFL